MMKRLTAILLVLALLLSATSALAAKREKKVKEPDVLDFVTTEKIVTTGDFDFDLVFELMHESFDFHKAEHPGTDMFLDYTTDVYEDGMKSGAASIFPTATIRRTRRRSTTLSTSSTATTAARMSSLTSWMRRPSAMASSTSSTT